MLDYDSGFIDKKTLKDTTCEFNIGAWIAARQDFKAEFGYYPLKINKYKSELPLIWEE